MEYLPEENENSLEETNKCAETKDEAKKDENKTVAAGTVKERALLSIHRSGSTDRRSV